MDYVVQDGDTLSEILYDITGDGTSENYEQVAADNNIENPDSIQPGQVIHVDIDKTNNDNSNGSDSTNINSSGSGASLNNNGLGTNFTNSGSNTTTNNSGTETNPTNNGSGTTPNNDNKDTSNNSNNQQKHYDNWDKNKQYGYTSNPPSSSSTAPKSSPTSTAKQSNGSYKFTSSLEDDDDIQMDIEAARTYINGTMDKDLGIMFSSLIKLIDDLTTMQKRQFSKTGTNVDQDYLDFEAITEALSDFLVECNRVLDDINSYINANERTLYS